MKTIYSVWLLPKIAIRYPALYGLFKSKEKAIWFIEEKQKEFPLVEQQIVEIETDLFDVEDNNG